MSSEGAGTIERWEFCLLFFVPRKWLPYLVSRRFKFYAKWHLLLKVFFTSFVFNHVVHYTWVNFNFSSNSYRLIGDSIDALNTYLTTCRCKFASKTAASFWTLILWEAGTISFFYLSQHLSCGRLCPFPARDWQLIATKPPFFGSSIFC